MGQDGLHSTGTFSAPGADDVVVYFARSPERGTDGYFLEENRVDLDILTEPEIAAGAWLDSDTLNPGTYYVMLRASNSCDPSSACAEGFSAVMALQVPKPTQTFVASKETGFGLLAGLSLYVSSAGEDIPYTLCWTRTRGKAPRCKRGRVVRTDWTSGSSDTIYLSERDLRLSRGQRKLTFKWYVDGRKVASRKASLGQLFE